MKAIEALDLHPVIDQVFPLDPIVDAFALPKRLGHFGKILIEI